MVEDGRGCAQTRRAAALAVRAFLLHWWCDRRSPCDGKRSAYLHLGEATYALLVLTCCRPLFSKAPGALVPPLLPVSLLESAPGAILPFLLVACIVTPIPVLAIFKIAAPFLAPRIPSIADPKRVVAIVLDILLSGLVLATLAIHLFKEATGPGYFRLQPALSWVVASISLVVNAASVVLLIAALSRRDDAYQEYLAFRREEGRGYATLLSALRRPGIQKRLSAVPAGHPRDHRRSRRRDPPGHPSHDALPRSAGHRSASP
jgi:hypothetical protein